MWRKPLRSAFGLDLLQGLAKGECLSLRENIGEEHIVVASERIEWPCEGDKVARYEPCPLMNQLVKRVLTVSARFAPVDWTGCLRDLCPNERDVFAITLHRQLLQVRGEALQIPVVWQDRNRLGAKKVVVPDGQQAHQHRQVALQGSGHEVRVDLAETVQNGAKILRANCQHCR